MIPLNIVNYENMKLDLEISKYVNKNIEGVIRVLLDYIESDPEFGIDFFFPRDYLERKPEECKKNLYELYESIKSPTLRDYIKPKYEYALYAILQWWQDVVDSEEDLLIYQIDELLIEEIKKCYPEDEGTYIVETITTFKEYEYICLEDFDFLPTQLNELVTIYLRNPQLVKQFAQYDDLDDYVDLMECDLRERYLVVRSQVHFKSKINIEEDILAELINVIKTIQKRVVHYVNKSEIEITADIHDQLRRVLLLKHDIHISREFTMGRALKSIGETDLYLYKEDNTGIIDYTILENKIIDKFQDQYYQLIGYLNHFFEFGITLSINRDKSLQEGYKFIIEKLNDFKGQKFEPIKIGKIDIEKNYILFSEHVVPENGNRMRIYHMILQLNDKERKFAALKARK
jgi:hypothetical protein